MPSVLAADARTSAAYGDRHARAALRNDLHFVLQNQHQSTEMTPQYHGIIVCWRIFLLNRKASLIKLEK
jgi:hypothetical protein